MRLLLRFGSPPPPGACGNRPGSGEPVPAPPL